MMGLQIVLGVSGGVAAYKSAMLASSLVQQGASVQVVLTAAAENFIGAATFEALTAQPVLRDAFDAAYPLGPHIALAEKADLFCVAPATANFLGKAANGIADDLLTTLFLSIAAPVLLAPAMNCEMWAKPSVQRNVKTLQDDGVHFVGPESGWLSCRKQGLGRMSAPESICRRIAELAPSLEV